MPVNATNNRINFNAPDFNLKSVNETKYSLSQLSGTRGTLIAFICNHCPYVIDLIDRLTFEARELNKLGIATIAIMSNDTDVYPADSFENMKKFSLKYNFDFPYLYDETQEIARKYKAICTPDFFGFNKDFILQYRGRLDSGVMNLKNKSIKRELFYAMELIGKTNIGPKNQINSFGCSIKWKTNE